MWQDTRILVDADACPVKEIILRMAKQWSIPVTMVIDTSQHPAGRVGTPEDIAEMVMFLCDNDRAGFITGENIVIDGGMSKLLVYHNDNGWRFN